MKDIKVLGSGCPTCQKTADLLKAEADKLGVAISLEKITDNYYLDSAESVVRYFLANAGTWRGEVARRIKAELKEMLKNVEG